MYCELNSTHVLRDFSNQYTLFDLVLTIILMCTLCMIRIGVWNLETKLLAVSLKSN